MFPSIIKYLDFSLRNSRRISGVFSCAPKIEDSIGFPSRLLGAIFAIKPDRRERAGPDLRIDVRDILPRRTMLGLLGLFCLGLPRSAITGDGRLGGLSGKKAMFARKTRDIHGRRVRS